MGVCDAGTVADLTLGDELSQEAPITDAGATSSRDL